MAHRVGNCVHNLEAETGTSVPLGAMRLIGQRGKIRTDGVDPLPFLSPIIPRPPCPPGGHTKARSDI
jgi:hypothetical protein